MYYDLSKSQKKIARRVMDKGLDHDYQQGLSKAAAILDQWKAGSLDNRSAYMTLFSSMRNSDKTIARRYNDKGGSRWVEVMADQLANDSITEEDIAEFNDEVKNVILRRSGKRDYDDW